MLHIPYIPHTARTGSGASDPFLLPDSISKLGFVVNVDATTPASGMTVRIQSSLDGINYSNGSSVSIPPASGAFTGSIVSDAPIGWIRISWSINAAETGTFDITLVGK